MPSVMDRQVEKSPLAVHISYLYLGRDTQREKVRDSHKLRPVKFNAGPLNVTVFVKARKCAWSGTTSICVA